MPQNTTSLLIPKVCQAIIDEYKGEVIKLATAPEEWRAISDKFGRRETFSIHVVHLMASTSTASVLHLTIKGRTTPLSSWHSLMLITNSSGQTSAVWDQHQTLTSAADAAASGGGSRDRCERSEGKKCGDIFSMWVILGHI